MSSTPSLTASTYASLRTRAQRACVNCAKRKTRCDAVKPTCGYCALQDIDCSYLEPQGPRIDPNTRVILERIHQLEERLFTSPALQNPPPVTYPPPHAGSVQAQRQRSDDGSQHPHHQQQQHQYEATPTPSSEHHDSASSSRISSGHPGFGSVMAGLYDVEYKTPPPHTAGSIWVYELSIVQDLLAASRSLFPASAEFRDNTTTTSVFFKHSETATSVKPLPESWRLFRDVTATVSDDPLAYYRDLIHLYFQDVNPFFPLLAVDEMFSSLGEIAASELRPDPPDTSIPPDQYCLLMLILAFASLVASRVSHVRLLPGNHHSSPPRNSSTSLSLSEALWDKAELLLGRISSDSSLEAAHCCLIASIFLGARGHVAKSYKWSHEAAIKCEALVSMSMKNPDRTWAVDDPLRRLYWISYIWEADFTSEFHVHAPSGIARYEDHVPYPLFEDGSRKRKGNGSSPGMIAFQVSTNISLRRCLNRVNSLLFASSDHESRESQLGHIDRLLRTTQELWTHHTALFQNIPAFLLRSNGTDDHRPRLGINLSPVALSEPDDEAGAGNNPWNVTRLKGRFYAAQYIIHRPFIELVLLTDRKHDENAFNQAILENCRACLEGCMGFVGVFDLDQLNSVTCLFSAGIVTFKMVMILIVSTTCRAFRGVLPPEIENSIAIGKTNLKRFGVNIKEFSWHSDVLDRLDAARRLAR